MSVTFWVSGKPEPQGSSKAFVVKGKARITSANPSLEHWRRLVADQAQGVVPAPITGPVHLILTFFLPRPKSLPKKVRHHTKRPDLDKLVRAVNDSLTHVVLADDSQVTSTSASKVYAQPEQPVGCRITVMSYEEAG